METPRAIFGIATAVFVAVAAATVLAAVPALADERPIWQYSESNDPFSPIGGLAGSCVNYGTSHKPARGTSTLRANFHDGDDEVWIYDVVDAAKFTIVYATSLSTCRALSSGRLKPP